MLAALVHAHFVRVAVDVMSVYAELRSSERRVDHARSFGV